MTFDEMADYLARMKAAHPESGGWPVYCEGEGMVSGFGFGHAESDEDCPDWVFIRPER